MAEEAFLARWSRRKADARQGELPPEPSPQPAPKAPLAAATAPAAPAAIEAPLAPPSETTPPPTLQEADSLTPASDFSRFVAPDVAAEVKNAALKKLFADPHFNLMDGLDTYIEDFGRPDPLPAGMLQQMAQARFLGLLAEPADEQASEPPAAHGHAAQPDTPLQAHTAPDPDPNDEDPDLLLQPDDAAGPAGPEASPVGHAGREHGRA